LKLPRNEKGHIPMLYSSTMLLLVRTKNKQGIRKKL
jgi:hypothetical protein